MVDALASSVKAAYPRLAHRYYKLKAKWFGVDKMPYWDRNAPLPEHDDRTDPVGRGREDRARRLRRLLAGAGVGRRRKFFGTGWIDAPARPGKSPGAFAHPTVPSAHPYLLLNYQGKVRDVMTLAHELGHGVHQVLAARQGALMADTPLTLAETASVFGEMLTFQSLLKTAPDASTRKAMLAGKVEDMLNTVVRQIAFYDFESRLHAERRKGELTPDAIGEIWMAVQSESLGPAFTFDDEYKHYWSYIGHFIHSPFYVYAYAFGDCLVNSLYAAYQSGLPDFQAQVSRHAEGGRREAAQGAAGAVRPRRLRSGLLGQGAGRDRGLRRRAREVLSAWQTTKALRWAAGSAATPASAPRSAAWRRGSPASAISAGRSTATSTRPS